MREPTQLSWEKHPKIEILQRALQVSRGPPGEERWKGDWGRENSRFKRARERSSVASPATQGKSYRTEAEDSKGRKAGPVC